MPQVVDNQPITDDKAGSVYLKKYKAGNKVMEYKVKTLDYLDSANEKKVNIGFTLAKNIRDYRTIRTGQAK